MGIVVKILWRWIVPIVAFVIGGAVGLVINGYSVSKLFFRGVEVDLMNIEATAEALRNDSETFAGIRALFPCGNHVAWAMLADEAILISWH